MLISIISPAKKLDFETAAPVTKSTEAQYLDHTQSLIGQLKKLSVNDVKKLMSLSDSLAQLNHQRFQDFRFPLTEQNAKQAMYAFTGDTYVGLNALSFSQKDITYAQKSLRILSGLYGVLRPLDLIAPYRLEMGTRFSAQSEMTNLYQFWQEDLSAYFKKLIGKNNHLINLASKEYFSAVDFNQLQTAVITPQFKQLKNGELKSIGMMSKRARGMLASFIVKNQLDEVKKIHKFNMDGYRYSKELSNDTEPLFIKEK